MIKSIAGKVTTFNEDQCLQTNPFEGDFGGPGDRTLKDKIVTARKTGPCSLCRQDIQNGERIRIKAAIFDGALMHYRWCSKCCAAMAASWHDDGKAWEARARLARRAAGEGLAVVGG